MTSFYLTPQHGLCMYVPPAFRWEDAPQIRAFIQRFPFATLVSCADYRPLATHLPFVLGTSPDAPVLLLAHLAKANPQCAHLQSDMPLLVIFSEPHAYISPQHYDSAINVPTWNYMAVHAYGKAHLHTDPAAALQVLEQTIQHLEPSYFAQWQTLPASYKDGLLNGILAFSITVTEWQAVKKLSQNKTAHEQQTIQQALSQSPHTHEQTLASYMPKQES